MSSGCLAGVTRSVLLEEVRDSGYTIREKVLFLADLETADEVFITSTTRELLPVIAVEGLNIRRGHTAVDCLEQAFAAYVKSYIASRSVAMQS